MVQPGVRDAFRFQSAQERGIHADGWRRVLDYLENHFQRAESKTADREKT
jgi:hypothetical protein